MIPEKKPYRNRINWPPEVDDVIRECYGKEMYPVVKLKSHPVTCHYRPDALKRRAYTLGCRVRVLKKYSDEEMALIIQLSDTKTPWQIAKMLSKNGNRRTSKAIKHFLIARKIPIRPDTYCITDLMAGFRCTARKVMYWIERKKLEARRDPGIKTRWRILPVHVAQFVYRHPFELETCRPDIPWLVALLMEYKNRVQIDYRDRNKYKKQNEIEEDDDY